MLDHAGLENLAGRIHDAADGPFGPDAPPLHATGIDALELLIAPRSLELVEVPPRHSVYRGDHGRVRSEQGLHVVHDRRDGVGF